MLQCVAVCCSVLQCVADVCDSIVCVSGVAVYCSVLYCVAVFCNVLQMRMIVLCVFRELVNCYGSMQCVLHVREMRCRYVYCVAVVFQVCEMCCRGIR